MNLNLDQFSVAGMVGGFLFSGIGFVAFVYGKKTMSFRVMAIGLALMGYPMLVRDSYYLYLIGCVLTGLLYFWRD